MNHQFRHSFVVHLIAVGGSTLFGYLAYRCFTDPFVRGGMGLRIGLLVAFGIMAVGMIVLYLTEGVSRYEVTDHGFHVHRLFRNSFHPWSEVAAIHWNRPLHFVVVRGHSRRVAFISTDFFPHIIELLRHIHQRSGCVLPPALSSIVASETP
jgi:hypothetical protein